MNKFMNIINNEKDKVKKQKISNMKVKSLNKNNFNN